MNQTKGLRHAAGVICSGLITGITGLLTLWYCLANQVRPPIALTSFCYIALPLTIYGILYCLEQDVYRNTLLKQLHRDINTYEDFEIHVHPFYDAKWVSDKHRDMVYRPAYDALVERCAAKCTCHAVLSYNQETNLVETRAHGICSLRSVFSEHELMYLETAAKPPHWLVVLRNLYELIFS